MLDRYLHPLLKPSLISWSFTRWCTLMRKRWALITATMCF